MAIARPGYCRGNALITYRQRFFGGTLPELAHWVNARRHFLLLAHKQAPAAVRPHHQARLFYLVDAIAAVELRCPDRGEER